MLSPEFSGAPQQHRYVLVPLRPLAIALSILFLASCNWNPAPEEAAASAAAAPPPSPISLSTTHNLSLTTTQQVSIIATTKDTAGVKWSVTPAEGKFSPATSHSGEAVAFTAPSTAGVYTLTATNVTDGSTASSATVAVTDLQGVYTYRNNLARSGANSQEYALTPSNVNAATFGKLFSCTVDGVIYAQPLWTANLNVAGTRRNVVFVATDHDSLFAFDADNSPCEQLWSASLLDAAHGGTGEETAVPSAGPNALLGEGHGLIPETGITGTPVIDPNTQTLYVVSMSVGASFAGTTFYDRLHAIDLATGNEKPGSPITINASYPGTGDGTSTVTFNPGDQLQRSGLTLVNGTVVIAFASNGDVPPYYGWVIGYHYDGLSFTQTAVLNVSPNTGYGGIWMAGGAPAADEAGNLYLLTGNGPFDANNTGPLAHNDYGDSLLKLNSDLTVSQYFTPSDQALDASGDGDFGSGAALVLTLPQGSPVNHLIVGGGKDGNLDFLNGDALGGYGDDHVWQQLPLVGEISSTAAFWNNYLYISAIYTGINVFQLDPSTAHFAPASPSPVTPSFYIIGSSPSISAVGTSNGIVWALENGNNCRAPTSLGSPTVLSAFDASNVSNLLWTSSLSSADTAGNAQTFNVLIVANGKVYVGTRGTGNAACSLTSSTGELDVYGLKN